MAVARAARGRGKEQLTRTAGPVIRTNTGFDGLCGLLQARAAVQRLWSSIRTDTGSAFACARHAGTKHSFEVAIRTDTGLLMAVHGLVLHVGQGFSRLFGQIPGESVKPH